MVDSSSAQNTHELESQNTFLIDDIEIDDSEQAEMSKDSDATQTQLDVSKIESLEEKELIKLIFDEYALLSKKIDKVIQGKDRLKSAVDMCQETVKEQQAYLGVLVEEARKFINNISENKAMGPREHLLTKQEILGILNLDNFPIPDLNDFLRIEKLCNPSLPEHDLTIEKAFKSWLTSSAGQAGKYQKQIYSIIGSTIAKTIQMQYSGEGRKVAGQEGKLDFSATMLYRMIGGEFHIRNLIFIGNPIGIWRKSYRKSHKNPYSFFIILNKYVNFSFQK